MSSVNTSVSVIFTCFNRKQKTIKCIESLLAGNPDVLLDFIIVDDASTDGTVEAINQLGCNAEIIKGDGNLFWSGGMRKGIDFFLRKEVSPDYVLLVNDDVDFYDGIIGRMILRSKQHENAVIVGATCDSEGKFSYGAMQLNVPRKRDLYHNIELDEAESKCDTFNCNCVLIKSEILSKEGNFDPVYTHSLADLDYGLYLMREGYSIYSTDEYVGVCNKNSTRNTWRDTSLTRMQRLKKKESPKGAPFKEWFHFMNKNFGLSTAIKYSVSPYVRILLGK